ncbi:MAG: hypothetical protein R2880_10915 [Deinococcales bacterium]
MQTLKLQASIDADGHLRLDIPTDFPEGRVEIVIVVQQVETSNYDFSDLVGKLKWQGDAVEIQRKLRDEW